MDNVDNFRILTKDLADRIMQTFNQMKNESLTTSLLMLTIGDSDSGGAVMSSFSLAGYWEKLDYSCEKVAHEVDKMCFVYSKGMTPPTEVEYKALLQSIEAAFSLLVNNFYSLPKWLGRTMYDMVHEEVFTCVEAILAFVRDMEEQGAANVALANKVQSGMQGVKNVPHDNLRAAIKKIADDEALVADALSEILQELKKPVTGQDDDDNDDNDENDDDEDQEQASWTATETALLVYPSVGVIKTARYCLKKLGEMLGLHGCLETLEDIEQLDRLVAASQTLSPAVDDLVSALYQPITDTDVHSGARLLTDLVLAMLATAGKGKSLSAADIDWIELLRKTAEYNWNKLKPSS